MSGQGHGSLSVLKHMREEMSRGAPGSGHSVKGLGVAWGRSIKGELQQGDDFITRRHVPCCMVSMVYALQSFPVSISPHRPKSALQGCRPEAAHARSTFDLRPAAASTC